MLLLVPIIVQTATIALLCGTLEAVDQSAKQEVTAKQVVALVHEIYGLMGECLVNLSNSNFFSNTAASPERIELNRKTMHRKCKRLLSLVAGNKKAEEPTRTYVFCARRILDNWTDLISSYSPGHDKIFVSQFLSTKEYGESGRVLVDRLNASAAHILGIYRPMAKELSPEAVEQRTRLRDLVTLAIVANFSVLAVVAFFINKQILLRLSELMSHIDAFASNNTVFEPLSGSDELAELDRRFASMAEARNKLDQFKQYIREMVNHDMRAPLTTINLRLDRLTRESGGELSADTKAVIGGVTTETQRLLRLANMLLDVDKLEDGKLELEIDEHPVSIIVDTATSSVLAQAESRNQRIETDLEVNLKVFCDYDRTVQVFANLLSNAIKFSPKDSLIRVSAAKTGDGWVGIKVIDQGPGVIQEQMQELFTRFKQLGHDRESLRQGSGLGLFITKSLVEAQHGRIFYQPQEEGGACFFIELRADTENSDDDFDQPD